MSDAVDRANARRAIMDELKHRHPSEERKLEMMRMLADMALEDGGAENEELANKYKVAGDCLVRSIKIRDLKGTVLKKFKEENARLEMDQSLVCKMCPHPITIYYPDASGNNDSWDECVCCGANV